MIDHVYMSVSNTEKSMAFLLEALKPLDWRRFGNCDSPAVMLTLDTYSHVTPGLQADAAAKMQRLFN